MSSKNQIYIDGRGAVHTGSKGRVDAWQLYRQGSTVTPRLNVSKTVDAVSTSSTVSFFDCPAITTGSHIASSQGDEDTEGGLLNGGLKSAATFFKTGSSQLLIEGHEAVRAFDLCEPNRGNGPLMPVMQAGGAPIASTLPKVMLADSEIAEAQEGTFVHLLVDYAQVQHRYGHVAIGGEQRSSPEAILVDATPIENQGSKTLSLPLRLPNSAVQGSSVTLWLLENDRVPAYTREDTNVWLALGKNWAGYAPIPLTTQPITIQDDRSVEVTCIGVYPVRKSQAKQSGESPFKTLSSGWLYLFLDGYLWRECKVTTVCQGMPLYHFSDVNLITQQGRHRREASTQGRMETLLLPQTIGGVRVSVGVAFSETQWPWARVVAAGGMHAADPRVLRHRQAAVSDLPGTPSAKPHVHPVSDYPIATLHAEAESAHALYEGPLLVVPVD